MIYRRISWTINLTYSTSQEQLHNICNAISEYIASSDQFIVNPNQESFARTEELAASSIDLRVLCYSNPVGFTDFSKIKQNLIFEIIKIVRSNGSEFAYPSRSIYIENNDGLDVSKYLTDDLSEKISNDSNPQQGED